jgi:hypothetical protein
MPYTDVEKAIIDKLFSHGYIGKKHTPIDNIQKGFPSHIRGEVKKALKKLSREGLILEYITSHGIDVMLNKERMKEIRLILKIESG